MNSYGDPSTIRKHKRCQTKTNNCQTYSLSRKSSLRRTTPKIRNKCIWCGKKIRNSSSFEDHMRVHTKERPFACKTCNLSFTAKTTLRAHERTHTKPHLCSTCGKQFALKDALVSHAVLHHGSTDGKKFQCEQCGKCFVTKVHLKCHTLGHLQVRPFQCSECPKGFIKRGSLREHMVVHTKEKLFSCKICNRGFSSLRVQIQHERQVCSGVKPFRCKYCQREFSRNEERKRHEYVIHERNKVPARPKNVLEQLCPCKVCGKCFNTRRKLSSHEREHSRPKPFGCETCFKRFRNEKDLERHLRTHSKREYICEKCGESAPKKSILVKHKCARRGETPIK